MDKKVVAHLGNKINCYDLKSDSWSTKAEKFKNNMLFITIIKWNENLNWHIYFSKYNIAYDSINIFKEIDGKINYEELYLLGCSYICGNGRYSITRFCDEVHIISQTTHIILSYKNNLWYISETTTQFIFARSSQQFSEEYQLCEIKKQNQIRDAIFSTTTLDGKWAFSIPIIENVMSYLPSNCNITMVCKNGNYSEPFYLYHYRFNEDEQKWKWVIDVQDAVAFTRVAMGWYKANCITCDKYIYFFCTGPSMVSGKKRDVGVMRYSLVDRKWKKLKDLPISICQASAIWDDRTNKIYLYGLQARIGPRICIYDISTDTWSLGSPGIGIGCHVWPNMILL